MTYDAKESSVAEGNPIYLYRFTRGATTFEYTNHTGPITAGAPASGTFTPAEGLTHGPIRVGQEINRGNLEVTLPITDALCINMLTVAATIASSSVEVYRGHFDDGDAEWILWFSGKLRSCRPKDLTKAVVNCISELTFLGFSGLGTFVQRTCRWPLYGPGCDLDINAFYFTDEATAYTNNIFTITDAALQPDGYYNGGRLKYLTEQAFILSHVGNQVHVRYAPPGLKTAIDVDDTPVEIARGCDRSYTTCLDFGNGNKFSGYHLMPEKDPFNDGSIA